MLQRVNNSLVKGKLEPVGLPSFVAAEGFSVVARKSWCAFIPALAMATNIGCASAVDVSTQKTPTAPVIQKTSLPQKQNESKEIATPAGGESVLPGDVLEKLGQGVNSPDLGNVKTISIPNGRFPQVLQFRTVTAPQMSYNLQTMVRSSAPIKAGDVLWATFWARAVESKAETGEATSYIVFERASDPWTKLTMYPIGVGKQWTQYAIPFRASEDYAAGATHVAFHGGTKPQLMEIAGLQVLNYGNKQTIESLPQHKVTYEGIEADAPWRKLAAARIEKHRKGDLRVLVLDAGSKPVSGAQVKVDMTRHAFRFGSAVAADWLIGNSPDHEKYRGTFKRLFNFGPMENHLKMGYWEDPKLREEALQGLQWMKENNIGVHGHVLVWPSFGYSSDRIRQLENNPTELRKALDDHIVSIVSGTKGKIDEWDVMNEAVTNTDFMRVLGDDEMARWFELAHKTDPKAKLFYNDFVGFAARGENTPAKDRFEQIIKLLKAKKAPVGGIGIQSHFGWGLTPPDKLVSELDRWGKHGLDIAITEFDIDITDEKLQAAYLRDFYTAMFSHPAVKSISMWGFWEGRHWIPGAAMFRKDWSPRPMAEAYENLVLKEWMTNRSGRTGVVGDYKTRAFYGDYQVSVTHNGKTKTVPFQLRPGATSLSVRL